MIYKPAPETFWHEGISSKVVVFDLDGVLCNFRDGFIEFGKSLGFLQEPHEETYWSALGFSQEDTNRIWTKIKASPTYWRDLGMLITQAEAFRIMTLRSLGWDIYFATSRVGKNVKQQTEQWLENHSLSVGSVIITRKKGEFCNSVAAKYMIDDKAGNCVFASYDSPGTKVFILDQPYNKFDPEVIGSRVKRVKTVGEFLDEVEKYE